jgi:hypothetical protein
MEIKINLKIILQIEIEKIILTLNESQNQKMPFTDAIKRQNSGPKPQTTEFS